MVNLSIEQIKTIIDDKETTLIKIFNSSLERLEKKMENLMLENNSLRNDVVTLKKEVIELKGAAQYQSDMEDRVIEIKKECTDQIEGLKTERGEYGSYVERRFAEHEDRNRRNNLRFDNINDNNNNETWKESEVKVREIIYKLGLPKEGIKIERAHRVGRVNGVDGKERTRTIVVKFLNYKDRDEILGAYRNKQLWKDKVYINEDFSDFTMNIRRELFIEQKRLRDQGDYAKVVYNRIVHHSQRNVSG